MPLRIPSVFTRSACVVFSFLLMSFPFEVSASDTASIFSAPLQEENGVPRRIRELPSAEPGIQQGWLVFFWANWCVPCKEELKLVLSKRESLKGYRLVAVNVDEPGDWSGARTTLRSMGWNTHSLRDPAGEQFYRIQPSGELPLTLQFSPSGEFVASFAAVDEALLGEFATQAEEWNGSVSSQSDTEAEISSVFSVSSRSHFRLRDAQPNAPEAKTIANSSSVGWSLKNWSLRVTLNNLWQSPQGGDFVHEDELGESYVEWRSELETWPLSWSARLGDSSVFLQSGQLLSVKHNAGANIADRLRGGAVQFSHPHVTLFLGVGRIENRLFPYVLDPAADVSELRPETTAGAAHIEVKLFESNENRLSLGVGVAQLKVAPLESAGLPSEENQQRVGLGFQAESSLLDLGAAGTQYERRYSGENAPEEPDMSDALLFEASLKFPFWTTPTFAMKWPVTAVRLHKVPLYVDQPVLVDDNGTPFSADSVKALRVAPQLNFGNERAWSLTPSWVLEQGFEADSGEKQQSWGTTLVFPRWGQKLAGGWRSYESPGVNERGDEWIADGTTELGTEYLSTQLLWKKLEAEPLLQPTAAAANESGRTIEGQRLRGTLGAQTAGLLNPWGLGKASLIYTRTEQWGTYVGRSGLQGKSLNSLRLGWSQSFVQLSVAYGREPGGIVCSGGACVQRPPLDGWEADVSLSASF